MRAWSKLYRASGATIPECWPKEIKHEGHTISVSDIWFVGHHLGKLTTVQGNVAALTPLGAVQLQDGTAIPADVVVGCIGFERNAALCEQIVGLPQIKHTNYFSRDVMYLADAEIDSGAFNSFFGSSVLEMAKFFTEVYVEGLRCPTKLASHLWGDTVPSTPVPLRKWSQYISAADALFEVHQPLRDAADRQVSARTEHFLRTLPPEAYVEANRAEWVALHTRLNGGVPVPEEQQLPYFFDDAAGWCRA